MTISMTTPKNPLNKLFFIALLLAVLAIIIWFGRQQLSTATDSNYLSSQTVSCNFSQDPCFIKNSHGSIKLSVDNKIIQSFEPLAFSLQFTGFSPNAVEIEFEGVEMFMGVNQLTLTKQDDDSFSGIHTLPGHSDRSMTWRAHVTFIEKSKTQQVAFEFELD